MCASPAPSLRLERQLLRSGPTLLGAIDEVGRGALGGPVSVGVVLVDLTVRTAPKGLRDSKLLTPAAREALAPRLRRWALGHAIGHAQAAEIDEIGIMAALRLAAERALAALPARPDHLLIDGNHNFLASSQVMGTFDVTTAIKADRTCASVAAASVLAKTSRDKLMEDLASVHTGYRWEVNRGYATPEHLRALRDLGPCLEHRRSWRLPTGLAPEGLDPLSVSHNGVMTQQESAR
jgi:ribonuclease HII